MTFRKWDGVAIAKAFVVCEVEAPADFDGSFNFEASVEHTFYWMKARSYLAKGKTLLNTLIKMMAT